ncbi:Exocyst complex component SEC15B [Vitis vinifera]|uniref:Exocyst complex component n=1 Tax=Vitis vinifera TaxID=29760 RepID=A0A438KH80_VITVI|nr:Exocyst complex component SEC15B [Vitis vinifera]
MQSSKMRRKVARRPPTATPLRSLINFSSPPPSATMKISVLRSQSLHLWQAGDAASPPTPLRPIQRVGNRRVRRRPLLSSLDAFVEARNISQNVSLALESVRKCVKLADLCSRANLHLSNNNFYMALKCVDSIEGEFIDKTPSSTLRKMLEKQIPEIRSYIERKINKEFGDWLVEIRIVSRNLGQLAIGQASSARQREEELRIKQRQAEEQTRLSLRDCVYALEEEDDDDGLGDQGVLNDTFLESHQTFFAQIAGFFIVEDRVLRTSGGLILKMDVENLWETAVSKMCSVLEDQFSRMQTANHLLLIKDYVSLLGVTLRRYGYPVDPLLDVLSKHRDKYHELLLSDCRKQIGEVLAADKFEQMLMKKEYEYSMNLEFYDVVKKYLDRLLNEVLDGALLKLTNTSIHGVSQAMQVAANMVVLERACDFFFRHAAQLSGIPLRMAERAKVDGFMTLIENVNWMADEPPQSGNEFVNEVIIYLETLVSTAQQILPAKVLKRVLQDVLSHISEKIVGTLLGDSVKRFNVNAVMGIDVDIRLLESFADNQASLLSEADANQLKTALSEGRQLINLLLSNHPENFLNPVIRERSYNALDYRKVITISEKLRDPSDRLFGTFGGRGLKQNPKRSLWIH